MTTAAVMPKFPVMNIFTSVTIPAAVAQFRHRRERLSVTVVALSFKVCAGERETGFRVMVELPLQPVHRVVTGSAVLIETIFVRVIFNVTVIACFGRIAEYMCFVATFTFSCCVISQ